MLGGRTQDNDPIVDAVGGKPLVRFFYHMLKSDDADKLYIMQSVNGNLIETNVNHKELQKLAQENKSWVEELMYKMHEGIRLTPSKADEARFRAAAITTLATENLGISQLEAALMLAYADDRRATHNGEWTNRIDPKELRTRKQRPISRAE